MSRRGEVLVAIMRDPRDFAIARDEHWYRIPLGSAQRMIGDHWPPEWLAFYQTKIFGKEAHAINYYTRVLHIRQVRREELFPNEPVGEKTGRHYYQLLLAPLQELPRPIPSRRWRRIVFIPTTKDKFASAVEINDLYGGSPLEDRLWAEFKRMRILAERQELVQVKERRYFLDFGIHCAEGPIDVETDGDTWHANPGRAAKDNLRDNDIETVGWRILRFNTRQIREEMESYCLPRITDNINRLGGIEEGAIVPRKIDPNLPSGSYQTTLFDKP